MLEKIPVSVIFCISSDIDLNLGFSEWKFSYLHGLLCYEKFILGLQFFLAQINKYL
jgi:hypothetical protein